MNKESAFIKKCGTSFRSCPLSYEGYGFTALQGVKPYPVTAYVFIYLKKKAYTGTQRYTGEWREVYTLSHTVVITQAHQSPLQAPADA